METIPIMTKLIIFLEYLGEPYANCVKSLKIMEIWVNRRTLV